MSVEPDPAKAAARHTRVVVFVLPPTATRENRRIAELRHAGRL